MGSDYSRNVVNEKLQELKESHDFSFNCNCGDKEIYVSGKKVTKRGVGNTGWQEFIIEPRCSYYLGGYDSGGLSLSGGNCKIKGSHSCSHCSREGFNAPTY